MPADALITRDGPVSAPLDYVVPVASDIQLLSVTASFDGSGAGASWIPVLEFIAPNGAVVARCPLAQSIAAGGSADVSWFPWRRGLSTSVAPPPTPTGPLFAWYDFSDASTLTIDGSGKIQTILDKSGFGHHASQSTPSKRPSTSTVNGLTAGLFASASSTSLLTAQFATVVQQPITIFLVFSQTLAGTNSYFPGPIGAWGTTNKCYWFVNGNSSRLTQQADGGNHIDTAVIVPTGPIQATGLFHGASSWNRINGGSQNNGSTETSGVQAIALGTQFDPFVTPGEVDGLDGVLCEVMYYSAEVTLAQILANETYLKNKWGT